MPAAAECRSAAEVRALARATAQRRAQFFAFMPRHKLRFALSSPVTARFAPSPYVATVSFGGEQTFTVKEVQAAMCVAARVTMNDLKSGRRTQHIALVRQVSMALCKRLTRQSMPVIGREFGGRDHTTVLYGARKFETLVERAAGYMRDGATALEWAQAAMQEVRMLHPRELAVLARTARPRRRLGDAS